MRYLKYKLIGGFAILLAGCDRSNHPNGGEKAANDELLGLRTGFQEGEAKPEEERFSPWMTKAQLQVALENVPAGTYYAYVEGRENGGCNQYRAATATFPAGEWGRWAVFWGLSERELYDTEIRLLRDGYVRRQLQVFSCMGREAVYQGVWLQPASAPVGVADRHGAITRDEPATRGLSGHPQDEPGALGKAGDHGQPAARPDTEAETPTDAAKAPQAIPVPQPDDPQRRIHIVKKGETLAGIARKYRVPVEAITEDNELRGSVLKIGQKLLLPPAPPPDSRSKQ